MITRKELANMYGISTDTLTKRLKELGIDKRSRITPKELDRIYEELGKPYEE
jgi:DNA invertase Pin-like site-specific DNA recombinase